MIKLLLTLFLGLLPIVSKAQSEQAILSLSSFSPIVIEEENVIDVVTAGSFVQIMNMGNNRFKLSTTYNKGSTYVIFLKNNGEAVSYIVDIISARRVVKEAGKMYSGFLSGSSYFNLKEKEKTYPYFLSLYTKIETSNNTSFEFLVQNFKTKEQQDSDTRFRLLKFNFYENYVSWSEFSEPISNQPFYYSDFLRGYKIGRKTSTLDVYAWKANKYSYSLNKENETISPQGLFLSQSFENLNYKFNVNNFEDTTIPGFYINVPKFILDIDSYLVTSGIDDKYSVGMGFRKFFNQSSEDFRLRAITYNMNSAPNGAYGLYQRDDNFYETHSATIGFANSNLQNIEDDFIDYIPGVFNTFFSYYRSQTNEAVNNSYQARVNYGQMDKISLGALVDYSTSENAISASETFILSPRLSVYLYGDKRDGVSFKTQYSSSLSNSITSNITRDSARYRTTIGLYKNTRTYYYGGYLGNRVDEYNGSEIGSTLMGLESNYLFYQNTLRFAAERVMGEDKSFEDSASLTLRHYSRRNWYVYAKGTYKKREIFVPSPRSMESLIGNVGFLWRFSGGEDNVYNTIYKDYTTVEGLAFLDKNFNGVQDGDEQGIKGLKISAIKKGENTTSTDASGRYSMSGFSMGDSPVFTVENTNLQLSSIPIVGIKNMKNTLNFVLYEANSSKIHVKTLDGRNVSAQVPLAFSCEEKGGKVHKEVYTDYILAHFPKGTPCDVSLGETEENLIVLSEEKKGNDIFLQVEIQPKILYIEFTNKIRPIKIQGKIYSGEKNILKELEPYPGLLEIELPKGCQSNKNTKIPYNSIKKQIFVNISCF